MFTSGGTGLPRSQTAVLRALQLALLVLVGIVLSGCASTIRNDVTAFHEWPVDLTDPTYAFSRSSEQANNLEYRSYENLVRNELARIGFAEQASAPPAKMKVLLEYSTSVRDMHVIQPVATPDPFWGGPWGWGGPAFGPWRGPYGYYPPGIYYPGSSFYPPVVQQEELRFQLYKRQLRVRISEAATGKTWYDVTVHGEDSKSPLAEAMPYMVRAAFQDFPGPSGVPRVVEMKLAKPADKR